jgi:uncharacterized membrane protein YbaN (DUF454 family)
VRRKRQAIPSKSKMAVILYINLKHIILNWLIIQDNIKTSWEEPE